MTSRQRLPRRASGAPTAGRCLVLRAWRRRAVAAAFCLFACAAFAQRSQGAMLQDLLNGGALDVGDARFSDWQLVSFDATAATPDLSLIEVIGLAGDPENPAVRFDANGQLAVAGFNSLDLAFRYRVSPLPGGAAFAGHRLELANPAGNGGIALVSSEALDLADGDLGPAVTIADFGSNFFQLNADAAFAPQPGISVVTNVFLTGLSSAHTASIGSFTQRFAQVPEPSAVGLAAAGGMLLAPAYLLAAALRRRGSPAA